MMPRTQMAVSSFKLFGAPLSGAAGIVEATETAETRGTSTGLARPLPLSARLLTPDRRPEIRGGENGTFRIPP
jgi:hypothetical protein